MQKQGYCEFCAAHTTVYLLAKGDQQWWACKDAPGLTCHDGWKRMIDSPPTFTIADF
ncbi:hypothetical protein D3C72_2519950 [compost metagenome]